MKQGDLSRIGTDELTRLYTEVGVGQDDALAKDDKPAFRRLFSMMCAIEAELNSRNGDQRRALLALFDHPNLQVQLNAAKATLALEPASARGKIEEIATKEWALQGLDAGMTIFTLDEGIFRPR